MGLGLEVRQFSFSALTFLLSFIASTMTSAEVELPVNFANNFWVSPPPTVRPYTNNHCIDGCPDIVILDDQGRNDVGTEILRGRMMSSKQTNEDLKTFYGIK